MCEHEFFFLVLPVWGPSPLLFFDAHLGNICQVLFRLLLRKYQFDLWAGSCLTLWVLVLIFIYFHTHTHIHARKHTHSPHYTLLFAHSCGFLFESHCPWVSVLRFSVNIYLLNKRTKRKSKKDRKLFYRLSG